MLKLATTKRQYIAILWSKQALQSKPLVLATDRLVNVIIRVQQHAKEIHLCLFTPITLKKL